MSQAENDFLAAYNEYVDLNPSFKKYVVLFGFRAGYRSFQELADFAGRIRADRSSFKLESHALSISFLLFHKLN